MRNKYQIAEAFHQMCRLMDLNSDRVTRRAGLPTDWWDQANNDVTAVQFFQIWVAAQEETGAAGCIVDIAKAYAHGPFSPPIFAFSCAETLGLGLQRLADFKPLLGPMNLDLKRTETHLTLTIESTFPDLLIPGNLEVFELAYIVECARVFSGEEIVPIQAHVSKPAPDMKELAAHLGMAPQVSERCQLVFTIEDADRVLITRSPAVWDSIEPMLSKQLDEKTQGQNMSNRVRDLLEECLPGGCTNADDVARRLNTSKRSLQRRLKEEGTSFQSLLDEVRQMLAKQYLDGSAISVPEISHLLGFRDTGSFFRAFHEWTGATPGEFRTSSKILANEQS